MTCQSKILNREDLRDDISSLASNTSVENVIIKQGRSKNNEKFFHQYSQKWYTKK